MNETPSPRIQEARAFFQAESTRCLLDIAERLYSSCSEKTYPCVFDPYACQTKDVANNALGANYNQIAADLRREFPSGVQVVAAQFLFTDAENPTLATHLNLEFLH